MVIGRARVLVVDDEESIHEDYRRSLERRPGSRRFDELRSAVLGASSSPTPHDNTPDIEFELVHAMDGDWAVETARRMKERGERFSVAFVDMRMASGRDGIETARALREIDSNILLVVCTAYSDYTWDTVLRGIGNRDGVHLLRKPFDPGHVRRYASVLAQKWMLAQRKPRRSPLARVS